MKIISHRWFPAFFLAGLAALQLLAAPGHYLGAEHDDAQYVLSALSLLRGRYALGISPGDPALTFNTPGWPALLAPAAALSGDSPGGYVLWCWAWLAACDVLVWLWFRRRAPRGAAAAATALFALNPLILSRSGVAMTEIPFLAFALAVFLLLDRAPGWAIGGLLGWAWMIRPAAYPLFPAVAAYYALRRRWSDLAVCAAVTAVPLLLWKAWVGAHGDSLAEFSELALIWSGRRPGEIAAYAAANVRKAVSLWGATSLPWVPGSDYSGAALGLGALLTAGFLAGSWKNFRRGNLEPEAVFLGCAALMHAAWPWWYERYLVPYLPFLLGGLWAALGGRGKKGERWAAGAALLCLLSAAGQGRLLLRPDAGRLRPELARTYAWIKGRTAPQALFASAFYCRDAFYAARPFVSLPGPQSRKDAQGRDLSLADVLRGRRVRFVLWQGPQDLGSSLEDRFPWAVVLRGLGEELARPPFRLAFEDGEEGARIFEVGRD